MSNEQNIKKRSQHVFITKTLDSTGKFRQSIQIGFIPVRAVIHYVIYEKNGTEAGVSVIRCSKLNPAGGNQIATIKDGGIVTSTTFNYNGSSIDIQGDFEFEVIKMNGTIDTGRTGDLVIDIEFLE